MNLDQHRSEKLTLDACWQPNCRNYGRPVMVASSSTSDFVVDARFYKKLGQAFTGVACKVCSTTLLIRSVPAADSEYARVSAVLSEPVLGCNNSACENFRISVADNPEQYTLRGLHGGHQRYQCETCKRSFSAKWRQLRSDSIALVGTVVIARFLEQNGSGRKLGVRDPLQQFEKRIPTRPPSAYNVDGKPRKRTKKLAISQGTIYRRLDHARPQFEDFAAEHEAKLRNGGLDSQRMWISTDIQSVMINPRNSRDNHRQKLSLIASAEQESGYVLAATINYDAGANKAQIELECGNRSAPECSFQQSRFAHLWTERQKDRSAVEIGEMKIREAELIRKLIPKSLPAIRQLEADVEAVLDDPSMGSPLEREEVLPDHGALVRESYSACAHMRVLRELTRHTQIVRHCLDGDLSLPRAVYYAFSDRIASRTADVLVVRINKHIKSSLKKAVSAYTSAVIRQFGKLSRFPRRRSRENWELELILLRKERQRVLKVSHIRDRWVEHPNPHPGEIGKQILLISDYEDYHGRRMGNIYKRASLFPVDRFFQDVRRQLKIASRSSYSPTSARDTSADSSWSANSVARAIAIFRTHYNYCSDDGEGRTPAMKLGLTDRVWTPEEIFHYVPKDFRKAS